MPLKFGSALLWLCAAIAACDAGDAEPHDAVIGSVVDAAFGVDSSAASTGDAGSNQSDGAPSQRDEAGAEQPDGGTAKDGGEANLPPGVSSLFPAPEGRALCPDPTLRIGFSAPPSLGSAGKIQVHEQSAGVVASVDMAMATVSDNIGGNTFTLPRPVFVDGNEVVIYLKHKALSYGKSYYVTVDFGAIRPAAGAVLTISDPLQWRFSTMAAPPVDLSNLKVSLAGAGDFCSVQGALDGLPANNSRPALITIEAGLYHEIVSVRGKSNLTLRGADRKRTVIAATNNNSLNPGTATRSLMGFDSTDGLVVENLTIHNLTPQGGSQAEALRLQSCDKCVVRNADILSLQDTLLWSGRVYADNCYIEGNVDYVWGTGVAYFNRCELRTVGRSGVLVQARNAPGSSGYVFVDSQLTADASASSNLLARVDVGVYPGSQVAFVNCQMSSVAAAGWTITGGSPTSALRFWEYQSRDASGALLNVSGRANGSSQISGAQAASLRDPATVFNGWLPPN